MTVGRTTIQNVKDMSGIVDLEEIVWSCRRERTNVQRQFRLLPVSQNLLRFGSRR
jgi:hypothetical protein